MCYWEKETCVKKLFQAGKAEVDKMKTGQLICFSILGFLALGFFILPFFNYGVGVSRTVVTVIYGICCIAYFVLFHIALKNFKKINIVEDAELLKNKKLSKAINIAGKIFSLLLTYFVFTIIFLKSNYFVKIYFYDIIIYCLLGLLVFCIILLCISMFLDESKKFTHGILNFGILVVGCIFISLFLKTDALLYLLLGLPIIVIDAFLYAILESLLPYQMQQNIFRKLNMSLLAILIIILGGIAIYSLGLDKEVVDNIFVVYGAIIGGSLTLFGVLFSIKHQEKTRQDERHLQFKPHFRLISQNDYSSFKQAASQAVYLINFEETYNKIINMVSNEKTPERYKRVEFANFVLDNSDFSSFYLKELIVNNQSTQLGYFVKKSESAIFSTTYIDFPEDEEIALYLIVEDLEKRIYKYKVFFEKPDKKEEYIINNMEEIKDGN